MQIKCLSSKLFLAKRTRALKQLAFVVLCLLVKNHLAKRTIRMTSLYCVDQMSVGQIFFDKKMQSHDVVSICGSMPFGQKPSGQQNDQDDKSLLC